MDSAIRREFVSRQTIKLVKGDYPLNIFTVRVNDPRTVSDILVATAGLLPYTD